MSQDTPLPITSTIVVEDQNLFGITARVDGKTQQFPNLQAMFHAAVTLADSKAASIATASTPGPTRLKERNPP
jgi:hypothetical protein